MKGFGKGQRGQALVEFSIVGILFVFMIVSLFDIGRAVWNYNSLGQAVREGGRYAIVHGANSSDPSGPGTSHYVGTNEDEKVIEAVNKAAGGLDPTFLSVVTEWPDGTNEAGNRVKVSASYAFDPVFDMFGLVSFTMDSSTTMEITH